MCSASFPYNSERATEEKEIRAPLGRGGRATSNSAVASEDLALDHWGTEEMGSMSCIPPRRLKPS